MMKNDEHTAESKRLHDAKLRAAQDEAWTRGFGAPAHDPDPIAEPNAR